MLCHKLVPLALFICGVLTFTQTAQAKQVQLAIVIDDVGYSHNRGMRAVKLPGPITLAVLPFAPHTKILVAQAVKHNKDIIIHQPMEPQPSPTVAEEEGTLKLQMGSQEFDQHLLNALDAVPQRVGLSNHTGSLLTAHHRPMRRVMQQLSQRGLFFLDSRTTAETVALDVAQQMGVPSIRRDVFLDHTRTEAAISQAFDQAVKVARRKGHAVLVGHPYPVSLTFLEQRLLTLPADIKLVHVARLVDKPTATGHQNKLAQQLHQGSLHISPGQ